jgi:hypothetical protein
MTIFSPRVLIRKTPTKTNQLVPGQLFAIRGSGEGIDMLPAQLFRFEHYSCTVDSDNTLLMGTLWWRSYVGDRYFSGVFKNHWLALHHVNIGSISNGRHDFHLERIERSQVHEVLGNGKIYQDFIREYAPA